MNRATSRETGVSTTTTRVISGFSVSMKTSVPRIVITPENNWVKPISSPSAKVSTSVIIRETRSPDGWESR